MGAIELRNKIIKLLNTDNVDYLKDIFEFAKKSKSEQQDAFLELPNEIQDILLASKAQSDQGEVTSNIDVLAESRKRYNIPS
jgi:hypothetical protein